MNRDEQLVRERFEHLDSLPSPTDEIWSSITHRREVPVLRAGSAGRGRGRWFAAAAAVVLIAGAAAAITTQLGSDPEALRAGAGSAPTEAGATTPPAYQGLRRYNREAIDAIEGARSHSDAEIVVVMEARNVCQQVHGYVTGARGLAGALLAIDDSTSTALVAGEALHQRIDITQFAELAKDRMEESRSTGSKTSAQDFVDSECSGTDFSIPVLATDGS